MKRILTGLVLALALPLLAAAQGKTAAAAAPAPQAQKLILEFVDGADLTVIAPDASVLKLNAGIFEGDPIPLGATVQTGASTTAELKLSPNGTIVKLAKSTTFKVAGLATTGQDKNAFALAAGKIRAVAAKGGNYEVSSQTAVCGVRGTDFAFEVNEGKAMLLVAKGLVAFQKLDPAGGVLGEIAVGAGEAADAFAEVFASFKASAEQFAAAYADVNFQKLQELEVPGNAPETSAPTSTEAPALVEEKPAEEEKAAPAAVPAVAAEENPLVKWLREALGMELGSVTIADRTYAKAVIQPEIKLGKVKLGLYLPIIYSSNLFDPSDWYKPKGNNEWDFGTGIGWEVDPLAAGLDALSDLALKVKYFEYGRQLEDPFFVKVGNLKGLTLGHGLVMRDYANDSEFPSVRRVGLNLGVDGGRAGFEAIVNDLADPEIFGARLFFRPIPDFKLALGVSGVVDTAAAAELAESAAGDMMLVGAGLDLDLPIIQSELLGIRLFADGAATVPYVQTEFGSVEPGLKYELIYDTTTGAIKNWGAAAGLMGKVLFIDWRLEYRYFTGAFRPAFFDATYDRKRAEYAMQYAGYLTSPSAYSQTPTVMGVYGEGGFSIMKDKLSLSFGYMWPWSPDAAVADQLENDEFHARLAVKKGLIPLIDAAGSIVYDRRNLVGAIAAGDFRFFDENTVFGGELVVPVPKTPNLDLAILFATVPERDATSGAIKWKNEAQGIPYVKPAISIETRLHF